MSINFDNDQFVQAVAYGGQPPTTAKAIMADATWGDLFVRYVDDATGLEGDATYTYAVQFLRAVGNAPWSYLWELYGESGSPSRLPWPEAAAEIMHDANVGAYDEQAARLDLSEYCWEWTDQMVPGFLSWVASIQSAVPSAPTAVQLTVNDIDRAVVDGINQYQLKASQEGAPSQFWQAGDVVLIGGSHSQSYYEALSRDPRYCGGTIVMASKGGTFSSGEITVSGSNDQGAFKAAIRRFSNKKIIFG